MWRCKKCETWNEDEKDTCTICYNRQKVDVPKEEPVVTKSESFYDDWEKEPISRKDSTQNRKSKNVLKVLVIVMVVLLVILGFLFIALLAINQEAFAIAFHCENQIQGGVQYVLQPMREILAG